MELFYLCLRIFFVRILDVSLGTVRTIITVKGKVFLASCVGFVEVFVWFLIVREALNTDVTSIWVAISYSLGFATGTYIGGVVSDRFIAGTLSVQVITNRSNQHLLSQLRKAGFAVSIIEATGYSDAKYLLLIEIDKRKLGYLKKLIMKVDPKAFIVVGETRYVQNGYFK